MPPDAQTPPPGEGGGDGLEAGLAENRRRSKVMRRAGCGPSYRTASEEALAYGLAADDSVPAAEDWTSEQLAKLRPIVED